MIEALIITNAVTLTPLGNIPLPYIMLDGIWVGSLGNGLSGETVLIYTVTFVVLVVLAIALATLIRCEIGKEGGEGEGGKGTPPSSSPS